MAVDPASGMDLDHLWLDKDEARRDVVTGFRQLAYKIEEIRLAFSNYSVDMGMGDCNEGKSWNNNMTQARDAVLKQLTDYINKANDFANKAEAAINALDGQDRGSGQEFAQLNGQLAHPPLTRQGNGWV